MELEALFKLRNCLITTHRMMEMRAWTALSQEIIHLEWCIEQLDDLIKIVRDNIKTEHIKPKS